MADTASTQPNTTLYINNLNDKINKEEIRSQLYALFTTYGKLIDVVATKTPKMRGQAFLVFTDLASATAALRACDGLTFYDKPMVRLSAQMMCGIWPHVRCAKSVFHMPRANPTRPCVVKTPTLSHQALPTPLLRSVCVRLRNLTFVPSARRSQMRTTRRWISKMMMRQVPPHRLPLIVRLVFLLLYSNYTTMFTPSQLPIQRKCNLPTSCSAQIFRRKSQMVFWRYYSNSAYRWATASLSVSHQSFRYRGFQTAQVKPSTKPNAAGEKVKTAEVVFENAQLATVARQMLDGFQLKKGWNMAVAFLP